ncbi:MAG: TonB-dependent receptor [Acidobacteria bacterium]|nr:TonB-dependent receptor [Acidobacteriota bacterium]
MNKRLLQLAIAGLCLAVTAMPAAAQVFTGRIDIAVVDSTGAVLPGVMVELSGDQMATAVTDARGEARFLNLAPGKYTVSATLSGFGDWRNENVPVVAGASSPLRVSLAVGGVSASVNVTAAAPTIDPKRTSQSTNVTYEELQNVPSSRDPWVVLQTIPGVIVDRVNVGGAESGQQSNFQAKGASGGENTWNIDGVAITDMSALGSSPGYYDFDMFQEMQATTGGADVSNVTPGVALNFVLKSGSNTPRGSARWYFENEDLQANNLPSNLQATLGGTSGKGNRMKKYTDYGLEVGGPIWKDKIWAWGAYGKTDVTVLTLSNTPDQTILKNTSLKTTAQATANLRGNFTYYRAEKNKFGRSAGPTRPPETTWNQGGPTQLFKGEGNLVVGNDVFLTARWAYVDGGFFLTPQGGLDTNMIYSDDSGIGRNSWYDYTTVRPQNSSNLEGTLFRGRHEVKAGFGYRTADVDSAYTVPGNGIITYHDGYPNMIAEVTAWNKVTGTAGKYVSGFLSDTISLDRMTINLGVRWDRQSSSVMAYSQGGNPIMPTFLPDLTGQAADDVIVWSSITPRVGVNYALTDDRKTIGRLSYAAFASQMNAGAGGFFSTVGSFRGVYVYDVTDLNGNGTVDAAELAGRTAENWYGFDINDPGNVSTPNHTVGDYQVPTTHEAIFGVDHELRANLGVSASYTYRKFVNFNWRPVQGLRSDDYVQGGTFSGNASPVGAYSVPYYITNNQPADRNATEYVNRDGYSQRFSGFEMSATKRMSDKWMARFGFSINDHREYFEGANALTDPTSTLANPNIDGGQVMRSTGGSGKSGIYMVLPKYQFILTGMYQAPYGINFGMNMLTRQGYAMPYNQSRVATGDALGNNKTLLLVKDVTDQRLPTVTSLDLRVGKEFNLGRTKATFDFDLFNALNSATVLGREYDLRPSRADTVREIMNPRILRLGVRFSF